VKSLLALFLFLTSPVQLFAQRLGHPQSSFLAFTHVTVIDMTGAPPKPNTTVLIAGNRIAAVGPNRRVRIPRGAQTIDATGMFLIPGLWDMHVHALRPERVDYFFPLFIANGVTGIREMGTTAAGFAALQRLRLGIAAGTRTGPRIIAAGRILDGARPAVPENSIPFSNDEEARQAVRDLKQGGADFIKVYDGIPRSSYLAIVEETKKQRIPFAGHVPTEITSFEASDLGQKSFEHLGNILRSCSTLEPKVIDERAYATMSPVDKPNDFSAIPKRIAARTSVELDTYSEQKCIGLFARFVRNETWQVPTLVTKQVGTFVDSVRSADDPRRRYVPAPVLESWKPENNMFFKYRTSEFVQTRKQLYQKELELVGTMHRAGVRFMTGTDTPGAYLYPGFSLHDELALFVQAGFTTFEALQAATRNPAEYLNRLNELGTVEKGKLADLVLLEANPLEDINNTKKIAAVVFDGRYLSREARAKMLLEIEAAFRKK